MTFSEALSYLSSLRGRGWRLGLDRIEEFLRRADLADALGQPRSPVKPFAPGERDGEAAPRYLHVAGTNGKGSVTEYSRSLLVEAGYRTGSYFSPYVYDVRERIQFGRDLISRGDFARLVERLASIADSLEETEFGAVTEFEFKTAMGFAYWKERRAEWVALEVGMGGRLDATNVVNPACSIIVSIGLDHQQYLGDTLGQIATEKAGILKAGVPGIVGDVPTEAWEAIVRVATERGCPLWRFGRDIALERDGESSWRVRTPAKERRGLEPGLFGPAQPHNLALAIAAMDAAGIAIDDAAVRRGATRARLPGRFERRRASGVEVVLDGAHNPSAARELRAAWMAAFGQTKPILLTGMVGGHDPPAFYAEIAPWIAKAHCAPIAFHRALPAEEVRDVLSTLTVSAVAHSSAESALDAALEEAKGSAPLLVTGSFYLVGEVGTLLAKIGLAQPV